MALITTPGAANAEAYASVAEYDAYLAARGIANATATEAKENALRVGASYLENQYRGRWVGARVVETQSLAWPRRDGVRGWGYPLLDLDGFDIPVDAIPAQIKNANIEAARLSLASVPLEPRLERGGMIKSIGKSVGPLRKDITYMDGAPAVDRFLAIEGLLRGLVSSMPGSTSGNVRLVRS